MEEMQTKREWSCFQLVWPSFNTDISSHLVRDWNLSIHSVLHSLPGKEKHYLQLQTTAVVWDVPHLHHRNVCKGCPATHWLACPTQSVFFSVYGTVRNSPWADTWAKQLKSLSPKLFLTSLTPGLYQTLILLSRLMSVWSGSSLSQLSSRLGALSEC